MMGTTKDTKGGEARMMRNGETTNYTNHMNKWKKRKVMRGYVARRHILC